MHPATRAKGRGRRDGRPGNTAADPVEGEISAYGSVEIWAPGFDTINVVGARVEQSPGFAPESETYLDALVTYGTSNPPFPPPDPAQQARALAKLKSLWGQ